MSDHLRVFIALDIPSPIRKTIADIQSHFKAVTSDVRWTGSEHLHLTLKFLGEVQAKRIPQIIQALKLIEKEQKPVTTAITQIGSFPNASCARIIWAGLKDETGDITRLADSIETALGNIGFKKEPRPFSPHVTIGRVTIPKKIHWLERPLFGMPPSGIPEFTMDHISLYKSTLTPQGPLYESLHEISLKTPSAKK